MSFSCVRTLRFFFAAGICSVVLATGVNAQETRYLRCDSRADIEFYRDIRGDLPESFVEDWVGWNGECHWTGPSLPYVTAYGDTVSRAKLEDWEDTEDPEILRVWLWYEAATYALREEFLR